MADELISREEALGGLPAGRASAVFFAIESRTAYMVAHAPLRMELFLTEEAAQERDLAFLQAFALGREPPLRPAIGDLERYAPSWAPLVPENTSLRAAVARLFGQKYRFTYEAVPAIRAVLGLDEEGVQKTYQRLYGQPLSAIFAAQVKLADRLRSAPAVLSRWMEVLPPFWVAFVLIVALSLSQTFLALPIAVADVGPMAGVALLIVLGSVNVLTTACMAEAISRNGTIRYGSAMIGWLVSDYLGSKSSLLLTLATFARVFLTLLATYIGLAATMAHFTPVPAGVWAALLFFTGLYLLASKSVNFSLALVALLGAVNIGLLAILTILAFTHLQVANLSYVNAAFLGPRPLDLSLLQRVFGVVLMAYIGSAYITQCAKVVLPRDPSGRSLIWGSVAGTTAVTVFLCVWMLAVNGAVAPQALSGVRGTVLPALAAKVGAVVNVLGSILIVLLLGMAWIRQSSLLFALIRERLPVRSRPILLLPRGRGRLLFRPQQDPGGSSRVIALTYLGLEGVQPKFRIEVQADGTVRRLESAVTGRWDVAQALGRALDGGKGALHLTLEVLDADRESVRLRVASSMIPTYEGEWDTAGLHVSDVLALPDPLRQMVNWMTRRGEASLAEVAALSKQSEEDARTTLNTLVEQRFLRRIETADGPRYGPVLARRRRVRLPQEVWQALREKTETGGTASRLSRWVAPRAVAGLVRDFALSERGRFCLSTGPELMVFLLTEWLLLTGGQSFTSIIALAGVIGNSLLSGIFPVLLLASSRRKGELLPGVVIRFLGHPTFLAGIYVLFLANLFLHGLVIWRDSLEGIGALLVGLLVLAATAAMVRQGAFTRRLVVELKEDRRAGGGGRAFFGVTAGGQPAATEVQMSYADGEQRRQGSSGVVPAFGALRSVVFHLPPTPARELKVWVHTITSEGNSEGLPALLEFGSGNETRKIGLQASRGQTVVPLAGDENRLRIVLLERSPAQR